MSLSQGLVGDEWTRFADLLRTIPDSGADGFEGLVAALFGSLTGLPFLVASSGRQPLGDATARGRSICVQAKRYQPNTHLPASDIVSDFHEVSPRG